MTRDRCRSCGASIIWAHTTKGNLMPVDADPSPTGNVSLSTREGRVYASVAAGPNAVLSLEPLHLSHFVTCPNADRWRNR